jgi:hypothetical protein
MGIARWCEYVGLASVAFGCKQAGIAAHGNKVVASSFDRAPSKIRYIRDQLSLIPVKSSLGHVLAVTFSRSGSKRA